MKLKFITLIIGLTALVPIGVRAEDVPPPRSFSLCANCHVTAAEGMYRHAPPLDGIVGRDIASAPNFDYSDTLKAAEGVWTTEKLDAFLTRPNHAQPGTGMYFRGIRNPQAREVLIKWLSENTVPSVIAPSEERRPRDEMNPDERAAILFRPCGACHSFGDGEPAQIGPNLWGIVGRPVASFPDFNYSERLMRRGGIWTEQRLQAFFLEDKAFDQGSHVAFRALQTNEDRALLIGLLKTLSDEEE
jgi:cytochrome c